MANQPETQTTKSRTKPEGFDVTRVVGRVTFGEGEQSAHEAAFALIAREDSEGTYTFPMSNGGTCAITVEYRDQPSV